MEIYNDVKIYLYLGHCISIYYKMYAYLNQITFF